MLQVAGERVAEHGWDNVRLIASPVACAPIEYTADAALFCAVHDVLQPTAALDHIFAHLRPGAPVAAAGGKWPAPWLWPLQTWVTALHAPFVTDFTGFDRPWRLLAQFVPDLRIHQLACTTDRIPRARSHQEPLDIPQLLAEIPETSTIGGWVSLPLGRGRDGQGCAEILQRGD